ncbi:Uncharacterized protein TCM_012157 [Theobroma cacao]|uniref:Uncharacterized protein n=1 Tax=Theobroma cacao TaxID=3641 RepID=A0A061FVB5_THECC|nr:Uncharacterized protein TCM_012157 [Theobroma cacao]
MHETMVKEAGHCVPTGGIGDKHFLTTQTPIGDRQSILFQPDRSNPLFFPKEIKFLGQEKNKMEKCR